MADITGALETHIKGLRRYAMALAGNLSDADDLVQETLRRALSYSGNGTEIRDLRAYLFTILHNVRVDAMAKKARAGIVVPLTETTVQHPSPPSQERRVEYQEVQAAIECLPEDQRSVILLVGLEGLSYQEAADVLGVPIGTVMSRLNRGREALRKALGMEREGAARRRRAAAEPTEAHA